MHQCAPCQGSLWQAIVPVINTAAMNMMEQVHPPGQTYEVILSTGFYKFSSIKCTSSVRYQEMLGNDSC